VDEIALSLPRERAFGGVAGLVLGGAAARHGVTVDVLDDFQLALDSLLDQEEGESDVQIVLKIEGASIDASIGPFDDATVAELEQEPGESLGLSRLLATVVDTVTVNRRADGCFVELHKVFQPAAESA